MKLHTLPWTPEAIIYSAVFAALAVAIGGACQPLPSRTTTSQDSQATQPAAPVSPFYAIGGPTTVLSITPNLAAGGCVAAPVNLSTAVSSQMNQGNLGSMAAVTFGTPPNSHDYLYYTQFPQSAAGNPFGLGLEVIDLDSSTAKAPLAIIPGTIQPFGSKVVVSPRGHYAYAYALPNVLKIDITTQTLAATYAVPLPPPHVPILGGDMALIVAPNQSTDANDELWIAQPDPQDVVVFLNASTGQPLMTPAGSQYLTAPVENPLSMVADSSNQNVYVSTTTGVAILNTATHTVDTTVAIPTQGYLALSPLVQGVQNLSSLPLFTNAAFTLFNIDVASSLTAQAQISPTYTLPLGLAYHNDPRVAAGPLITYAAGIQCPDGTLATGTTTFAEFPVLPASAPDNLNRSTVSISVDTNPRGLALLFDSSNRAAVFTTSQTFDVYAGTSHVLTAYPALQTNPSNPAESCVLQNWSDGATTIPHYITAPASGVLTLTANFTCQ